MPATRAQANPATPAEPEKPSSGRYFYGWNIVGVMAAAAAVNMAMGTLNFGFFIKPMGDELGIGRSFFGWATTGRQVTSATTSPYVGRLLDRFGARVMLPLAALLTAGAMVGLSFTHHSWQLVFFFCLMGLIGMSGPGALVTAVPVLKWFVRNRGKAIAFAGLGIPIGSLIFVPLTQHFIDIWGWRTAWVVLASIAAGILVPLAVIVLRRQPEDMGLLPDGASVRPSRDPSLRGASMHDEKESWTIAEARRTVAFWQLVIVFSLIALGQGMVAVHRIPEFQDRGVSSASIAFATTVDAVAAGLSTFLMGMLATRVNPRYLGSFGFSMLAVGTVFTIYADTAFLVYVSMITFGVGVGGMMFTQNFIWADYFGRAHVGTIRGWVMPIMLIFGAAGSPTAGYVYDAIGSYNQIWWVGFGLMAAGAVLVAFTMAPKRPPSPAEAPA